jgi:hypothetical protein
MEFSDGLHQGKCCNRIVEATYAEVDDEKMKFLLLENIIGKEIPDGNYPRGTLVKMVLGK